MWLLHFSDVDCSPLLTLTNYSNISLKQHAIANIQHGDAGMNGGEIEDNVAAVVCRNDTTAVGDINGRAVSRHSDGMRGRRIRVSTRSIDISAAKIILTIKRQSSQFCVAVSIVATRPKPAHAMHVIVTHFGLVPVCHAQQMLLR